MVAVADDVSSEAGAERIVAAALTAGGDSALHFARELAYRWESSVYSTLNLELLLEVAYQAGEDFFAAVMTPTFGRGRYREDSLGEAFCRFIESKVLPGFRPEESHPYDPIFRLLILLLPIGATPVLNSPAFATFERLSEAHPS